MDKKELIAEVGHLRGELIRQYKHIRRLQDALSEWEEEARGPRLEFGEEPPEKEKPVGANPFDLLTGKEKVITKK